jgi:hypothetical protein
MAVEVVNWKHVRGTGLEVEYVGRWHPEFKRESPLKNDWSHEERSKAKHKVAAREEAVACYRRWLWGEIKKACGPAYEELLRLAKIAKQGLLRIACWCHPEACHAHIIARAIEYLNARPC